MSTACALLAICVPATGSIGRAAPPSVADLLAAYADRHGRIDDQLRAPLDLDRARDELDQVTPRFLAGRLWSARDGSSAPPAPDVSAPALEGRRRDVAAFALDIAAANITRQAPAAERLIEWACHFVRRHAPADDFDAAWHHAAISLLEGAIDPDALRGHLAHAESQFPEDPTVLLGRAIADEQMTAPVELIAPADPASSGSAGGRNRTNAPAELLLQRALGSFERLRAVDALRGEAALRAAHVLLQLRRFDDALATAGLVESQTTDPYLIYLGRLFKGLTLEAMGRAADAQAAFRSALVIGPGAHAATVALATSLFRSGQRVDADRLLAVLVRNDDPSRDAWWSYWAGDYRKWRLFDDQLRRLLP